MNESINDFIYNTFTVSLFVLALSLFILINEKVNQNIDYFNRLYEGEIIFVEETVSNERYISMDQLIAGLYNGVEYDIEIEGVSIDAGTRVFEYIIVDEDEYLVNESIDSNGSITKITYTGR